MWKYLIILLHVSNSFTSGDRDNIMIDIHGASWLNDKDFEMMIRYSYPFSMCCNTVMSGMTEGITRLFNRFIQIYEYEYTTGMIDYDCRGYFLLGSTGERLTQAIKGVPTAISTTEILIVVDTDLRDNSPLLNVSLFHHANVNIVSRSGKWTLTENYLQPRVFKKVSSYPETSHKSGNVDLEGRQLQVAVASIPPFSYLSTIVNRTVNGIAGQFYLANNERELDGVEVKLFLIMAEHLNFTWMMRKPFGPYNHGRENGTHWNGGVIGQLFNKEVDVAFGGLWVTYARSQYVNLSVPWYKMRHHFLVPRPKPIEKIWALARPFSLEVWIALMTIVVLKSIVVWWQARVHPRILSRFRSYMNALTEMIGRFVGTWAPRKTPGCHVQLQLWHFTGLLVVTFYCSNLAAILTTPDYEPRIDTVQQFIEANLTWSVPTLRRPFYKFWFNLNDPYEKHIPDRIRIQPRQQEENNAILGSVSHSSFVPQFNISRGDFSNYRLMRETLTQYYVSLATQSWLVHSIDRMMLRLSENGLVEYHLQDVTRRRINDKGLREVFIEYDGENTDGPRALKLKPLAAGFIILFAGYILATIVFCFELKNKIHNQSFPSPSSRSLHKLKHINSDGKDVKMRWKNVSIEK